MLRSLNQERIVFLIALVLFVGFAAGLPGFLTSGNILSLIQNVSILATARLAAGTVIGSNDGEADAFRFVAPEAIEQASFSPPEFPAFAYFRAWRETGQFQFV